MGTCRWKSEPRFLVDAGWAIGTEQLMFAQTMAFLTRSIRQESRLLTHHAVRGAMVFLALVAFFWQVAVTPKLGASGLVMVQKISAYCYYSLTLLGIMYFSLAITEEKEEETLPLLRMTGVRNFTLLIGKSMPRLAIVMLLILVAAPFLLLSISLGGVVPEQILAIVLGMMCYAFCLSQLGLFCSTISRNSQRAVSLTFLLWLVLEFGSWLLTFSAAACKEWGFQFIQEKCEYLAEHWWQRTMWSASGEYLSFVRGDRILHSQMSFHLCVGAVFFLGSWLLFETMNQASLAQGASASENLTRGIKTRTNGLLSLRCGDFALAWKSWQFQVGGWLWMLIGVIGMPVFSVGIVVVICVLMDESFEAEVCCTTLILVGAISFLIIVARLFGRVLNQEIHQQTLVSLCMLPKKRWAIISELHLGLLPGTIGPVICFGLGWIWLCILHVDTIEDITEVVIEPWFWAGLGWLAVTLHVGALLSVYVRHGGMLIAIAVCYFVVPFVGGIVIGIVGMIISNIGNTAAEIIFRYMFPLTLIAAELAACVAAHGMIFRRIEVLAGK